MIAEIPGSLWVGPGLHRQHEVRAAPQLTCISSQHRVFCRTEDLGPVPVNMLPQGRSRDIARLCFDGLHLKWRASLWGFFVVVVDLETGFLCVLSRNSLCRSCWPLIHLSLLPERCVPPHLAF